MDDHSVFCYPILRGLLFLGLGAPLLLSGCLPSSQTPVQPYPHRPPAMPQVPAQPSNVPPKMSAEEQAAYTRQVLEPALSTISGRIAAYGQKLEAWQNLGGRRETLSLPPDEVERIVSCRNRVADLQDAYKGLQDKLLKEQSVDASRELLFSSLQDFKEKDIAYLEGECPQLFTSLSTPKEVSQPQEEGSQQQIGSAVDSGQQIDKPVLSPQEEEPLADSSSRYSHCLALLKKGHEQEVRRRLAELLKAVRQQGEQQVEVKTLQTLAELEFGLREYASARKRYTELLRLDSKAAVRHERHLNALEAVGTRRDELDAYALLLLACLTYSPDEDGFTVVQQASEFTGLFPDSPLAEDAEGWSKKIAQEADQWFSGLITEADRLQAMKKTDKALQRLEQVPLDILPLDKQDILRQKKEALESSNSASDRSTQENVEAAAPKLEVGSLPELPPSSTEQQSSSGAPADDPAAALQETWDKGMMALRAENYDQAIRLFSELRSTTFSGKAEEKIEEAERLAAESLRKKAAELFQQASNAADPETKKKLLLSSKKLLEDILRKYPRSGIEVKVKRNLSSVDKELGSGTQHLKP